MQKTTFIRIGIVAGVVIGLAVIGNFALTGQATGGGGCGGSGDEIVDDSQADGSTEHAVREGEGDEDERENLPDNIQWADPMPEHPQCDDYDPLRRPLFGDLHVHTKFSFDSYTVSTGEGDVGPREALDFALGNSEGTAQLGPDERAESQPEHVRPRYRALDFVAVTDHSEFLGPVRICQDSESPHDPAERAQNGAFCRNWREQQDIEENQGNIESSFGIWGVELLNNRPVALCRRPGVDCPAAMRDAWAQTRNINNQYYRDHRCDFTPLHGYEWDGTGPFSDTLVMWHRVVLFRDDRIPRDVVSFYEARTGDELAWGLHEACAEGVDGCQALAIPHNSNWSRGIMYRWLGNRGRALRRALNEPLAEIIQAKQDSECRQGFAGYPIDDELCDFEKTHYDVPFCRANDVRCRANEDPEADGCIHCIPQCGDPRGLDPYDPDARRDPESPDGRCESPVDYFRNALKFGFQHQLELGVNPFQFGFIASTDTHNGTPGLVNERGPYALPPVEEAYRQPTDFTRAQYTGTPGHHGMMDDAREEQLNIPPGGGFLAETFALTPNPGGLAVVWSEQNTRHSIFDALARRESYGTSGTRMVVRFFGGPGIPENICDQQNLAEIGYREGNVPMGGELVGLNQSPRFVVYAARDAESARLQRIQIIKVWFDPDAPNPDPESVRRLGAPMEEIHDLAYEYQDATIDLDSCDPHTVPGHEVLCRTWTDQTFDPALPVAYYARVLESPTCRWSHYQCLMEARHRLRGPDDRMREPEIEAFGEEWNEIFECDASIEDNDPWEGCCRPADETDPGVYPPPAIQERAWTSPIFHNPTRLRQDQHDRSEAFAERPPRGGNRGREPRR